MLSRDLGMFPAVALLGPRQCGKTTLARVLVDDIRRAGRPTVTLDLERPSDLARLTDAETFLERHADALVCIDEVQRLPQLFPVLRALIDADRRPGRFLLLGSASPALLSQSSETLAGRIGLHELTPFLWSEVGENRGSDASRLWLRGGFPDSFLAATDAASLRWRTAFVATFLERDLPQLGFRVPAEAMRRFWTMCAHLQGQTLNLSALARAAGTTHPTIRHHVDVLVQAGVLRTLAPLEANLGKRLVKSPKVYVRDSGLLHSLLDLPDADALAGHPVHGASWEGFVVEQLVAASPGWSASYYRTSGGDELDLVFSRRGRRIGVECKVSRAPTLTRGFWNAHRDLALDGAFVVAPVREPFPIGAGVEVAPLGHVLDVLRA